MNWFSGEQFGPWTIIVNFGRRLQIYGTVLYKVYSPPPYFRRFSKIIKKKNNTNSDILQICIMHLNNVTFQLASFVFAHTSNTVMS